MPLLGLVPVGISAAVFGPMLLDNWRGQQIAAHGVSAPARILDLRETGVFYNYQPVVAITLDVMPAGAPAYTAVTRQVVTVLDAGELARGAIVQVKFDPDHPDRVVIVDTP